MNPRRIAEWQIAFWTVFVFAFVAAGALPLDGLQRQRRVLDQGANNSTDAILATELGVDDATRRIAECLRDAPADSPIVLIYRQNSLDGLSAQLISRVAWPRRIIVGSSPMPGLPMSGKKLPAFLIGKEGFPGFRESRALSPALRFGQFDLQQDQ